MNGIKRKEKNRGYFVAKDGCEIHYFEGEKDFGIVGDVSNFDSLTEEEINQRIEKVLEV